VSLRLEQMIFGGYGNNLSNFETEYNSLIFGYYWSDTESDNRQVVSTDGKLKKPRIKLSHEPALNRRIRRRSLERLRW